MSGAEVVERMKEEGRREVAIKDLAVGIFDGPHATPKDSESGAIFLGIKNLSEDGRLDLSEIKYVSEEEFPKWTKRVVPQEGDVVFTYEATLHCYARIPPSFRGCLGRRVALVRPDPEKLDSRYLLYYFLSPGWRSTIEQSVIIGATVNRIPLERFPSLRLSVPVLESQKAIATLLSAYDDLIENNRRRIVLLEALARNLYQEWFVRLRFPGWESTKIVGGVPEGWESKKLNQIASYLNRGVAPTYDASGDIWVINQKCVRDNRVNLTLGQSQSKKVSEEKLIRHGDILVNSTGTGTLGRVAQVWSNPENTTVDSHVTIVRPSPDVQPLWLGFTLFPLQKLLEDMGEGATNQKELKRTRLGDIAILWPADGLRNEFEHCVAPMVKMIQILDDQNRALSRARDLLLPRLMSGELEP